MKSHPFNTKISRFLKTETKQLRIAIALLFCVFCLSYAALCSAQDSSNNTDSSLWRKNIEWEVLPFENPTITIQSSLNNPIMNGNGRIEVSILGGLKPLSGVDIDIYESTMNIASQWSIGDWYTSEETDSSGLITKEVKPGYYALAINNFNLSTGTYGIMAQKGTSKFPVIPITIKQGEVIAIRISLAKLVVGILSEDGKSVLPNTSVYVYPQTTDIAGNPIPLAPFGSTIRYTSEDGTCTWYVGAGEYTIRIDNYYERNLFKYNIVLLPGDVKDIIITRKSNMDESRIELYRKLSTAIEKRGRPTTGRVNMREEPSLRASVLLVLDEQDDFFVEYEVQNEGNSWYCIRLDNNEVGFMMSEYVNLDPK